MKFLPEFPLRSADPASEQSRGGPLSSILHPGLSEVVSGGWAVWRLALISGHEAEERRVRCPHHISDVSPWLPGYLPSQSRMDGEWVNADSGLEQEQETFIISMNLPGIRNVAINDI